MIISHVSESEFTDELLSDEYTSWSYGATKALYRYFEELSDDIGEDIQLDRVAIRCDWSEYDTCEEYASEFFDFEGMTYDENGAEELTPEEVEDKAREFLEERTTVLEAKTPQVTDSGLSYVTSYVIRSF